MEERDGKIISITEKELYERYLDLEIYEIMSFYDYKKSFKEEGILKSE